LIIIASRLINIIDVGAVAGIGLGAVVSRGIMAIALGSVGYVRISLYEAIEETNHKQDEAIAATKASSAQILYYAIWSQSC